MYSCVTSTEELHGIYAEYYSSSGFLLLERFSMFSLHFPFCKSFSLTWKKCVEDAMSFFFYLVSPLTFPLKVNLFLFC